MSRCVNCGLDFQCGVTDGGSAPCWCMQLPHHHALPASGEMNEQTGMPGCFCPGCLRERLQASQEQQP